MAASDILEFIAPEFLEVPPNFRAYALTIAEAYRPGCLNQALGDEAVALYAAWMLSVRACSGQGGAAGGGTNGGLIMEKEGDLTRQWAGARDTTLTAAQMGNYKARYDALAKLCTYGGIRTRFASVPIGGADWGDWPTNWVWPRPI